MEKAPVGRYPRDRQEYRQEGGIENDNGAVVDRDAIHTPPALYVQPTCLLPSKSSPPLQFTLHRSAMICLVTGHLGELNCTWLRRTYVPSDSLARSSSRRYNRKCILKANIPTKQSTTQPCRPPAYLVNWRLLPSRHCVSSVDSMD